MNDKLTVTLLTSMCVLLVVMCVNSFLRYSLLHDMVSNQKTLGEEILLLDAKIESSAYDTVNRIIKEFETLGGAILASEDTKQSSSDPSGKYKLENAGGGLYFVADPDLSSLQIKVYGMESFHTCEFFSACEKDTNRGNVYYCRDDNGELRVDLERDNTLLVSIKSGKNVWCGTRMGLEGRYVKH